MSSGINVRSATCADAAAVAAIYNHYIRHSTATFDTVPKSAEERASWIAGRGERHPVVVAARDGEVLGWGALSPWRERPAWSNTAEVAVYLAEDARGLGIGSQILGELVSRARVVGLHVLLSQIVTENEPSLKMAERAGFERVGTLREVGRKFDRWLDVALVELVLEP